MANDEYQQAAEQESVEVPEEGEPESSEQVELSVEALQAQLTAVTSELEATREQALRVHAEAQNTRHRAEKDVEKAHKFGQEKLVADLLPVVDNLERALATIDASNQDFNAVVEGIQLTLRSFIDTLARHHVVAVDPQGEPFDPQLHQAMSMVPNPEVEPNTVINVFQKGYTLHGRLVRPAMVVVAKAPE